MITHRELFAWGSIMLPVSLIIFKAGLEMQRTGMVVLADLGLATALGLMIAGAIVRCTPKKM